MTRLHAEQVRLEGEFLQRRLRLASEANLLTSRQAISSLSEEQIAAIGQQWLHQTWQATPWSANTASVTAITTT
jgi:hypothetical protein